MLKPLRDAVSGWRPASSGGHQDDPLLTVIAVWPELVGTALAHSARPYAIEGSVLVVRTASSAWSQQVSFLADEIVARLRIHVPAAGIARLRFRLGPAGVRRDRGAGRPVSARAALPIPSTEPPRSLSAAIERLAAAVDRVRDANVRSGWKNCRDCGVAIAAEGRCEPCVGAAVERRSVATQRLMFDLPWLGFAQTAALVDGLTLAEYEVTRHRLLARWWDVLARARAARRLDPGGRERLIASSYLLLHTGWEPDRITPVVARAILGDALFALLYEPAAEPARPKADS